MTFETPKTWIKKYASWHRPNGEHNVFLFSTPRSGSTWLMEMIGTQPGFKYCNEPLNLRVTAVRNNLGLETWEDLYNLTAQPKVENYFNGFIRGTLRFNNPNPLAGNYRPLTHRIVFKMLNAQEDQINWYRDTFNGRIVFLLRHPLAVSLSRKQFPRLTAFLNSDYKRHFTTAQLDIARQITATGTPLEKGILSWCFQNSVPLRMATADWAILSYEQIVLEPETVIHYLCHKLDLPHPERMLQRISKPSLSTNLSDANTQQMLQQDASELKTQYLVEKWQKKLTIEEAQKAMHILTHFDLDLYQYDQPLIDSAFWVAQQLTKEVRV